MFRLGRRLFTFLQHFLNAQGRIADAHERSADAQERGADALERRATSVIAALPPEGLSKKDAARFLGVGVAAMEQLIRTGKIAYVQCGAQRGRILLVEDLRRFLAENRQERADALPDKQRRRRESPAVIMKSKVADYLPSSKDK